MPVSDYLRASGVRIKPGVTGEVYENVGRITISKAATRGMDQNMFAVLKIVVDQLKLSVQINSIDTGLHSPGSRHYVGRAVDINKISDVGDSTPDQAMLNNPKAIQMVEYLLAEGFHIGEGKPWAAILFGPPRTRWNPSRSDHVNHLHMSLGPRPMKKA